MIRLILKYVAGFYRRLPLPLQKCVRIILEPLYRLVRATVFFCVRDLHLPVARLRQNGFTAIYIGHDAVDEYAEQLIFGGVRVRETLPGVFCWNLRRFVDRASREADFIWIKGHARLLAWCLGHVRTVGYPRFITQKLEVPAAGSDVWESIKNSSNHNDLRKVRNLHYTCEITHDPALLEIFYERMHRPFILGRYGEAARLEPLRGLQYHLGSGELLLVRRDGTLVSGVLARHVADNYSLRNLGVLEGDATLLKEGALAAAYYFAILEAQRKGCRTADFVCSPAFLLDGLLQYKKKWNTRIVRSILAEPGREMRLRVCNPRPAVMRFLERNPFVIEREGELLGLCFIGREQLEMADADLKSYVKKISCTGLAALVLVVADRQAAERVSTLREVSTAAPLRVVELCMETEDAGVELWDELCRRIGEADDLKPAPEPGRTLAA